MGAGPAPVRLRIHELEVEQHQIAAADDPQEIFRGGEACRAQDHVQAFQPLQHPLKEGRLHERLPAGEAQSAVDQQRRLAVQESGQLIGPVAPAGDPIAVGPVHNLGLRGPALRVVAPGAMKRASLEKHRGAQPGAVVNGQFTDVENHPGQGLFHCPPPTLEPSFAAPVEDWTRPRSMATRRR